MLQNRGEALHCTDCGREYDAQDESLTLCPSDDCPSKDIANFTPDEWKILRAYVEVARVHMEDMGLSPDMKKMNAILAKFPPTVL